MKNFKFGKLLLLSLPFLLVSCFHGKNGIEGKWECVFNAYGERWDRPLIMEFNSDGTGYQWFSDEDFSNRWNYYYYIDGKYVTFDLGRQMKDCKWERKDDRLTIYGWDDDDMSRLVFHLMKR